MPLVTLVSLVSLPAEVGAHDLQFLSAVMTLCHIVSPLGFGGADRRIPKAASVILIDAILAPHGHGAKFKLLLSC